MILTFNDLPLWWIYGCWLILIGLFGYCSRQAFLLKSIVHVRSLILILIVFLWLIRIDVDSGATAGMSFHMLGMTLACLVFGSKSAFVYLSCIWLTIYGKQAIDGQQWLMLAPNLLLTLLPAWLWTQCAWFLIKRCLPVHLFIFIFCNAFITAGLSMLLGGFTIVLVLSLTNHFTRFVIMEQILPIYILLLWGEAFLTGLITAVLVAFKPLWLEHYSDEYYLPAQKPKIWK